MNYFERLCLNTLQESLTSTSSFVINPDGDCLYNLNSLIKEYTQKGNQNPTVQSLYQQFVNLANYTRKDDGISIDQAADYAANKLNAALLGTQGI